MRRRCHLIWTAAAGLLLGSTALAIEEAAFTVEIADGDFQVRRYAPQVAAEIVVDGPPEDAGNRAFRPLFRYISGANRTRNKLAMTAPVGQQAAGRTIAMTAPVGQQAASNRWAVSFMMPATSSLETLPEPTDPRVRLRAVPARRMAAVRYSGTWSRARYERQLARLQHWMATRGLVAAGEPVWARYNPPFTPWFLRRNEVLVPLPDTE